MKLLIQFFGTCPLLVSLSLLACIGFAAYALQLAPPAHQPFELELRFSYQLANSLFGGDLGSHRQQRCRTHATDQTPTATRVDAVVFDG